MCADPARALCDDTMGHVVSFLDENCVMAVRGVAFLWRAAGTTEAVRRVHDRNIDFRNYEAGMSPRTVHNLGDGREFEAVAVAPDGTVFAADTAHHGGDGSVRIYDNNLRHLRTIDSDYVPCLCVGPGGDEIYAGSHGQIRVWTFDGTLVRTLAVPRADVWFLTFGGNGELYAGSADGNINAWDANGGHSRTWLAHEGDVWCLAASPQFASLLYSGGDDNKIKKWNTAGRCLRIFEGHTDCVNALTFGPCGVKLYSS